MTDNPETDSSIDVAVALTFTDGDREMLKSVAELFLKEGPRQLQMVESCVKAADAAGTRAAAHTLRGSVAIFGADQAAVAAAGLEDAASGSDFSAVPIAWEALNQEMQRVFRAIERLCGK